MTGISPLRCEASDYLANNEGMTPAEAIDLLAWINSGESVRENPWSMTDEQGHPMDYLAAKRTVKDLHEQWLMENEF